MLLRATNLLYFLLLFIHVNLFASNILDKINAQEDILDVKEAFIKHNEVYGNWGGAVVAISRQEMSFRRELMDSTQMTRAVRRLAHQLVENISADEMVLVGVRTRGVPLANRLKAIIDC